MKPSWNALKRIPSRIRRRVGVLYVRRIKKRGRPRPEPLLKGYVPQFRRDAQPRSYSFVRVKDWAFYDRYNAGYPCFVLKDAHGKPRFVLGYRQTSKLIEIRFIQRLYSDDARSIAAHEAKKRGRYDVWGRVKQFETAENKVFAEKLGMHPVEFLLSEFIYRNRDVILDGGPS